MNRTHLLVLLGLLALAPHALAATFTANSSVDLPDDNPGDGVCRSSGLPPSSCTLRAAIMEANALAGTHTINLQAGRIYTLTRSGQDQTALNGDLDITKSLTIRCLLCGLNRPVVDANGLERGFEIFTGDVTFQGFTIWGGYANLPGDLNGGAIAVNFGAGQVELRDMVLENNRAVFGGALYNDGPNTRVFESVIRQNSLQANIQTPRGSAIRNRGTLFIDKSTIANNGDGGTLGSAIDVEPGGGGVGSIRIDNSTVSSTLGNGLRIASTGQVELRNVTVANNTEIGMVANGPNTNIKLRNSLFSGNGDFNCQIDLNNPNLDLNGYNLDTDVSCGLFDGVTNLSGSDAPLTPLKRRGGPLSTPVHWPRIDSLSLSAGSPTIGAGDTQCSAAAQNNVPRPQGYNGTVRCDIGAAEVPDDAIFYDSMEEVSGFLPL